MINARGKYNSIIYTRNRGGNIQKAFVVPTNTISPKKSDAQALLTDISQFWATLPQDARDEWNQAALTVRKSNSIGSHYYSSGFNKFVQESFYILAGGGIPTGYPVPPSPFDQVTDFRVDTSFPGQLLLFASQISGSPLVSVGSSYILRSTIGVSAGITSKSNWFVYTDIFGAGESISGVDLVPQYTARWGAPVSGSKIFWSMVSVNVNSGHHSAKVLKTCIVP